MLKLLKHKFGDHDRSLDKPGFAYVGDPAVDNDAGVQNFVLLQTAFFLLAAGRPFSRNPHGRELFFFLQSHIQPDIAEQGGNRKPGKALQRAKPGQNGVDH
ncbi:hypothetical protein D1872_273700 [compost metagenome]